MRKQYYLEISKQHVADLTIITQLKFLYSCSLSFPIVEFKISEITSFAKNKNSNRNLKYRLPIVLQENTPSLLSSMSSPQFSKKKILKQFKIPPLLNYVIIIPGPVSKYLFAQFRSKISYCNLRLLLSPGMQ